METGTGIFLFVIVWPRGERMLSFPVPLIPVFLPYFGRPVPAGFLHLPEHDSLVYVTGKRYWYWNSRGRSINALDYLIQIRGYGLVDAVHALVGGEIRQEPAYRSTAEIQVSKEPEKKAFSLPWARRCATAAVSY